MNKITFLLIFGTLQCLVAQVKISPDGILRTSQTHTFQRMGYQNVLSNVNYPSQNYDVTQRQNEVIIAEVRIRQKQEEKYRKRLQILLDEAVNEFSPIYYLPSNISKQGASYYQKAFQNLKQMSNNSFSVREAVFTVENAFYENEEDYLEFEKVVKQTGDFLRQKMTELGYDSNSNLAKNFTLFQFFTDTLEIKSKNLKHLPLEYDFEDFWGRDDHSKIFVKKLLSTGKGQCHSLPLFYMILAEEIDADVYLTFSPNHSYIKFQDNHKKKWYNVELTNQTLTTDAFVLQSGYVKAEAIQQGIYINPLTKSQLKANMIVDLASGYIYKYGYDEFVSEMIHEALQIDPKSITGHLIKSNYNNYKVKYVFNKLGITKNNFENEIKKHPAAIELLKKMINQHKTIAALGYQEMPEEAYQKWLTSIDKQGNKQQQKQLKLKLNTPIKQ
ncbi:hypothetical protein [Aquimarina algiphila]|uniref:Protein SirB1 N-terminal domain-containing protein n=1 Tax=Aquimarina algiphila TaxID=2047982 RepID=A0A554VJN3_9FLAO|nr:hypothetical protein [Aquimarina algiphila]TSE08126.1 hypothetical protein FOF46_13800 [Aquimarina algiphila]